MNETPFKAGQRAAREGRSKVANPHPKEDLPMTGDVYPGPHHAWLKGWRNEKWTMQHDAALAASREQEDRK